MKKFTILVILLNCCFFGGCTKALKIHTPLGLGIYNANIFYQQANYEECLRELKKLLAIDPDDTHLHYNLGLVYARLNQYSQARDEYRQALRSRKNIPEVHLGLGDLYLKRHFYRKAMIEYQRALTMLPNSVEISMRLANTYERVGKIKLAIKEYKSVLRDKPLPKLYLELGNIYYRLKRYKKAISSYSKALRLDPNSAQVYNNLGLAYEKNADPTKALASYQRAVQKKYLPAYINLGAFYRVSGKYELAKNQYLQALKIKPDCLEAFLNLGILYELYLSNHDQAIKNYRRYCRGHGSRSSEVKKWIKIQKK